VIISPVTIIVVLKIAAEGCRTLSPGWEVEPRSLMSFSAVLYIPQLDLTSPERQVFALRTIKRSMKTAES
jgi:hypothetical protein